MSLVAIRRLTFSTIDTVNGPKLMYNHTRVERFYQATVADHSGSYARSEANPRVQPIMGIPVRKQVKHEHMYMQPNTHATRVMR